MARPRATPQHSRPEGRRRELHHAVRRAHLHAVALRTSRTTPSTMVPFGTPVDPDVQVTYASDVARSPAGMGGSSATSSAAHSAVLRRLPHPQQPARGAPTTTTGPP